MQPKMSLNVRLKSVKTNNKKPYNKALVIQFLGIIKVGPVVNLFCNGYIILILFISLITPILAKNPTTYISPLWRSSRCAPENATTPSRRVVGLRHP